MEPVSSFTSMPTTTTHRDQNSSAADLTVLQEAAKLLSHSTTPELAINSTLRLMSQMLGLNRGRVLLSGKNTQANLRIRYSYGLTPEESKRGSYQDDEGITGRVMRTGQLAVVQNIDEEPDYLFRAVDRLTLPKDVVAYIAVPIMDGNLPLGVLACHRLRMRPRPIQADLVVLQILATFIAQIIRINSLIDERTRLLKDENQELKEALQKSQTNHGILGESPAIHHALNQLMRVADTTVNVLMTGESGTGKERFSHLLHINGSRRDQPFLAINCAAIPEQLLESELFGHERGAFTGAISAKLGKIEIANGGTLFLDEIGDLNLELQSKLLRVLESRIIQRVGGVKDISIDVRIVTATHKNLQEAVNQGTFRLDLFYRLNVFPIHLPPLRERDGDIRLLARHFLLAANREYVRHTRLGQGVMERLESYRWPGNIRQLENVIKRAVLIAQQGDISIEDIETILHQESAINGQLDSKQLVTAIAQAPLSSSINPPYDQAQPSGYTRPYQWVREDEAVSLLETLKSTGGNKTRAASMLGMTTRQFRYRLDKLGLHDVE
ncbi:sigma 54-interacting transcriptional regulator [Halomonas sp. MC140]|nr:sigma 54-interacting transcriptional regulator [Halomonas sp. MC140]MDN7130937.1 sigma 54-interacting transcriptional regulator [Halomonas sp. MC140]